MNDLRAKLVLGTVQLGMRYGVNNSSGQPSAEEAFGILRAAGAWGITTLDTADAYGTALELIGEFHQHEQNAIATFAPPFRIITKFHGDHAVNLLEKASHTLSALHITSLYCYQFHRFSDVQAFPHLHEQLADLKAQGIIERVGVSVYTNDELAAAAALPMIDVIQFPFNALDNMTQRGESMRRAKDAGKELHTRSVFLQGLFFKPPSTFPAHLSALAPAVERLQNLAESRNFDVQTLALNYALHNPLIDAVLFGVETALQLAQTLDAVQPTWDNTLSAEIEAIVVDAPHLLNPVHWQ
jgi:aryl-alcohol dehydrogenase-like predicted oxidoreductase